MKATVFAVLMLVALLVLVSWVAGFFLIASIGTGPESVRVTITFGYLVLSGITIAVATCMAIMQHLKTARDLARYLKREAAYEQSKKDE